MRSSRSCISRLFVGAALLLTIAALAGCGDFCITGFSANGTGQVNINGGNPPPPCTLPHVNTMMRAVALKTRACEACSNDIKAAHAFVTLQGIQLHAAATEGSASSAWIEIAPQFAGKPRQIDLIGNSLPELLQENGLVPSGNYSEVRLKLFAGSSENACGNGRWNCLMMANGQVLEFAVPNEVSELLLPFNTETGSATSVWLTGSNVELQLHLEPRQMFQSSPGGGWKPQMVLAGHATIEPHSSEPEQAIPMM